jgi:type II secretory pathway component PulF
MASTNTPPKKHTRLPRPSSKEREYFTNNFAMLLGAGVPVTQALDALQETTKSQRTIKNLEHIKQRVDEGVPLWKALSDTHFVNSQTLSLIELGEASGRLVENLRVAAKQEEKQRILKAKIRSAMMYPSFVIGLTLIIGLCVAWFLLPRLAQTFDSLGVALPLISRVLIGVGKFLQEHGLVAVPSGMLVVGLIIYVIFLAPKTRNIGRRILFHTPGIRRLLQEVELARFGYLFGTLLDAGLSITDTLKALQAASTMPQYQSLYRYLSESIDNGFSIRDSFKKYRHINELLPPSVQQMVIAGERSGSLPDTLQNIGTIYEEKANITTDNLEAMLEPILLLVVWFGVLGVAVAVILPIYSLVGGLQP